MGPYKKVYQEKMIKDLLAPIAEKIASMEDVETEKGSGLLSICLKSEKKSFRCRLVLYKAFFSGKNYDNPPEKLEVIKKKNRNGVTDDIMKEFESKWAKTENPFCP